MALLYVTVVGGFVGGGFILGKIYAKRQCLQLHVTVKELLITRKLLRDEIDTFRSEISRIADHHMTRPATKYDLLNAVKRSTERTKKDQGD